MMFPELKIIDKISNKTGSGDQKELLLVQIDWTKIDDHKINRKKNWYISYSIDNPSKEQEESLTQLLNEIDWSETIYPQKHKGLFDKYCQIKMPKSYYDECLYLMNQAIKEWDRQRPFDTNVREELLEAAIKYVDLFFYLISDAIYIYNSTTSHNTDFFFYGSIVFRSLMLYRFWKHQTGGGLLYDKSTGFIKRYSDELKDKFEKDIKQDLMSNIKLDPLGCSDRKEMLALVNQKIRDNKLNKIGL